ncbi:hypothetical protein FRB93_010087 [Tulasnella sp. JGI-2019a]|nr:hypothetical protein FRB93_010087 [Tulasnella sp. JGI-2019a]
MGGHVCNDILVPGDLQIASWKESNKNLSRYCWNHWQCISPIQTANFRLKFNVSNLSKLEGYDGLKDNDKARVALLLGTTLSPMGLNSDGATTPNDIKPQPSNSKPSPTPNSIVLEAQRLELNLKSAAETTPPIVHEPEPPVNRPEAEEPTPKKAMSAEELKDMGNAQFRLESYEVAIDMYSQAIALEAKPTFYTNRAAAYMALKCFEPAVDDCEVAVLLQDHAPSAKTLGRLAKCRLALGDAGAALRAAQAGIESEDLSSQTYPGLVATKASAELMQLHLDESQVAWHAKSWAHSRVELKKAAAICEGDGPAHWLVREIKIETALSNWQEATALAKKAQQLHPNSADVQTASAVVELLINCIYACLLSLHSALRKHPEHVQALALLRRTEGIIRAGRAGDRLYASGNAPEASEEYTKALDFLGHNDEEAQGGPLRFALLTNRSAAYTEMARFDLARVDCLAALSIPNYLPTTKILDLLAKCDIAVGDPEAALQRIQAALDIDPLDTEILQTKSAAERMLGDIQENRAAWAKKDWLQAKVALARATAGCAAEIPLQWSYWKVETEIATRCWEEAVKTAENVAALHLTSPHAFAILGLTLMLSNNLVLCPQPLQIALRLDPENSLAISTSRRALEIERVKEEGNLAFRWAKYPEAVEKYTQTLDAIGSDDEEGGGGYLRAALLANRANAFLEMERHARALVDIVQSLELRPTSVKELRTHARIRMTQGYFHEATTIYYRARDAWVSGDKNPADIQAIADELKGANAALVTSQSKDFYGILGVPQTATEADIKKAFRRSSLCFHPDKGGNPEHFKLVSEAYNTLSGSWV